MLNWLFPSILILIWIFWVLLLVLYIFGLNQIIQRMRAFRIEMRVGSPDEIPEIDEAHLDEAEKELEALGFERINDIVTRNFQDKTQMAVPIANPSVEPALPPTRLQPHILSRVMRHPQHGCLGIISSMAITDSKGKRQPKTTFWVSFDSFAASGAEKWSYSASGHKASIALDKMIRVCSRPRALWVKMPKASVMQLMEKHLSRREQIARAANVKWSLDAGVEDYIESEQEWAENARQVYGQLTLFGLWNQLRRVEKERKNPEWLGELKGRLQ